jgi:energy-coupling factor transporter ATP-binding protein EcfA2/sulfur relay (sulfurtransferase) DsrC/TusE family protein
LLFNRTKSILNGFSKKLNEKLKATCKLLSSKYEIRYNHLLLNPGQNANQWVILRDTIKECTNDSQWYNKDLRYIKKLWNIMYNYKMNIYGTINDLYWETIGWPKKILNELDTSIMALNSSKNDIVNTINNNREYIQNSIAAYLYEIQEYNKLETYDEDKMLKKMTLFRKRIDGIKENIKFIEDYEKKLELEPTDFSNYNTLYYYFEGHETLWKFCDEYKNTIDRWNESFFNEINADEVINKVNQWNKIIAKVRGVFENYPNPFSVVIKYQNQLKDYCRFLPIIISLRNPCLQQKHWEKIFQTIGFSQSDIKTFQLKNVIMMNFELVQDILTEISQNATNELKLQKKLEALKQKLFSKNFVINKSYKPYIFIENFHYLTQVFEDYLIKGERLGKFLSTDSDELSESLSQWNKKVLQCLTFLNQWEYLQSNYLKLYAFFDKYSDEFEYSSNVRNEYEHISKLMSLISDILDKNVKCMKILSRTDIFEMIKSSIIRVEKIVSLLSNYINSLRDQFPRFYFLSDKTILKVLINSYSIPEINSYIHLYFNSISKLDVNVKEVIETDENEEELNKNISNFSTSKLKSTNENSFAIPKERQISFESQVENVNKQEKEYVSNNNQKLIIETNTILNKDNSILNNDSGSNKDNYKLIESNSFGFDSFNQDTNKDTTSTNELNLSSKKNNLIVNSSSVYNDSRSNTLSISKYSISNNNSRSRRSSLLESSEIMGHSTSSNLNGSISNDKREVSLKSFITGLYSNDNEFVKLKNDVKIDGNIYVWLKLLDEEIVSSLKEYLFEIVKNKDFNEDFDKWIQYAPSQIAVLATQILYTKLIDTALESSSRHYTKQIGHVSSKCNSDISKLTFLLNNKADINVYQQRLIEQILDYLGYYREIINNLKSVENNSSSLNYEWLEKIKYYIEGENVFVKVFNYKLSYEFNFVGTYPRIILTSHQNNYRSTLITSLNISNFNSFIAPTGAGKTESLLNFAKSLGRELIIFECNPYSVPNNLIKYFKGYLMTGFWILFNNIQKCSEEYLSVILQYTSILKREFEITNNLLKSNIVFFNKEYELKPNHCIFLNLSLSDNIKWSNLHSSLKRLFRTNSIQYPDTTKIFEAILLTFGFRNYVIVSKKIVLFMKFFTKYFNDNRKYTCNIKAIKTALYSKLNKINKNRIQDEFYIIGKILNDLFLPEIQLKEMVLYRSLFKEIFNFNEKGSTEELHNKIEESCNALYYSPVKIQTQKIEQLYNVIDSGKMIILLGPSLSGKTTSLKILEHLMNKKYDEENKKIKAHNIEIIKKYIHSSNMDENNKESNNNISNNSNNNSDNDNNKNVESVYYIDNNSDISDDEEDETIYGTVHAEINENLMKEKKLKIHYIYPNACKPEEIYGYYSYESKNYVKGILENILDKINEKENDISYSLNKLNPIEKTWICFDSNGSPYWIDNVFSQIENRRLIQTINMDNINISKSVTFLCETTDINSFTPAFFSKSIILNYGLSQKISDSIVVRSVNKLDDIFKNQMDLFKILYHLFMKPAINYVTNNCNVIFDIHQCIYIDKIFGLLESLIVEMSVKSFHRLTGEEQKCWIITTILFCVIWVVGNLDENAMRIKFDEYVKTELLNQETLLKLQKFNSLSDFCLKNMIVFPREGNIYDYYFDNKLLRWKKWELKELDTFLYPSISIGYDNIVRTKESLRILHMNRILLNNNKLPLIVGKPGIGKTISAWVSINYKRKEIAENSESFSIHLNSNYTLDNFKNFIFQNLSKKRLDAFGLAKNKKHLVLIDDLNNLECTNIGHSSIIELLREWFDTNGWYVKNMFYYIEDVIPIFTATTSLSFKRINMRILKLFHCLSMDDDIDLSFKSIVSNILENHFGNILSFKGTFNVSLTEAMKTLYNQFKIKFPQTVTNPHYIIRLKDIIDIIHGVIEYSKQDIEEFNILKIWNYHCNRVIKSKLNNEGDIREFYNIMKTVTESTFNVAYEDLCSDKEPYYYFQYIISKEKEQKTVILQVDNIGKFFRIFMNKLLVDECNPFSFRNNRSLFKWVYPYALKTAIFLSRSLEISGGHIILLGNNEFDHSKLVRLSASLNGNNYIRYQEPTNSEETFENWREFIKELIEKLLINNKPTFLLISEFSIKHGYQINDIDSLMTTGFIYDLYGNNTIPLNVVTNLVDQLSKEGYDESVIIDNLPETLILFIKRNLHIVISTNIHNPLKELNHLRIHSSFLSKCSPFWYNNFDKTTQLYVSSNLLLSVKNELSSYIEKIQILSVEIFKSISKTISIYNKQYNKDISLSSKSYSSFIEYFTKIYSMKTEDINKMLSLYTKLIEKIDNTYKLGKEIKEDYYQWVKKYEQYSVKIKLFLKQIENEHEHISKINLQIKKEESNAVIIEKQITKLQDELENDCKRPTELIDESIEQIENLSEDYLKDLNFVNKPSDNEKIVIQTLCVVLNIEPIENESLWNAGKRCICEKEAIDKVKYYDLDNISHTIIYYIDMMIDSKKFDLDDLLENSVVVGAYASWILAIRSYYRIFHIIMPKKKKLKMWEQKLETKHSQISELRDYSIKQEKQLKEEKIKYDQTVNDKEKIIAKLKKKENNYKCSQKVIEGIAHIEENIRNKILVLRENKDMLVGDCICASFVITYTGPFTRNIKNKIIKPIFNILSNNDISYTSKHFSLTKFMKGDRWVDIPAYTEIPECLAFMDNLLQVKLNNNWCIISDKHLTFYKYYSMFDEKETVIICSIMDESLNRKLVNAIEKGHTFILILYEKKINEIPLFIRKLITKKYFQYESTKQMFSFAGVAENLVISPDFRLHLLITKPFELVDPEILRFLEPIYIDVPEEFISNILVDRYFDRFEPSFNKERKENTKRITDIFYSINKNIESMYEIINDIEMKNLYTGPIYENINKKNNEYEELNKKYDEKIKIKVEYNKKVKWITELCKHGSWMFQLMSKFTTINPMYQFNLYNYIELVSKAFKECPLDDNVALKEARSKITKAVYEKVSLVLHDYDRLVFSFIISLTNVFYNKDDEYSISEKIWSYFLNKEDYTNYNINIENIKHDSTNKVLLRPNSIYSDGTELDLIASKYNEVEKNIPWMTIEKWNLLLNLSKIDQFSKVPFDIIKSLNTMTIRNDIVTWDTIMNFDTSTIKIPPKIDSTLKTFEKILLSYYIRPHSLYQNLNKYVESVLGEDFTDINQNIFEKAYNNSNHHRPIIVLVDSDENNADYYIKSFVSKQGPNIKFKHLFFNKNTDEINAEMENAMNLGGWILLSNCETYLDWFKEFEEKLTLFTCSPTCKINQSFRLWLIFNKNEINRSVDITKQLPFSFIQNSVKIMIDNTEDFRFQLCESISIVYDIFTPSNISSVTTYQQFLYKLCIFFTLINICTEKGSLILNDVIILKLTDLKIAGQQLFEIYNTYFRNSNKMKTIQKLIKGMILDKNLMIQLSRSEDIDILACYFDDIMNIILKNQNGSSNVKNSYLAAKINPIVSNILNQEIQSAFESLQKKDFYKARNTIYSMNKKKNHPQCFGLGNYLRIEKSKQQSNNIMQTIKKLYIEDISNKCHFIWTLYDKIKNILSYYINKLNNHLKNTIFDYNKYSLDKIEKNIKITRYLDYVLLDSIKHYYALSRIVFEYFNRGLEDSFIMSPDYKEFAEAIIHNTLPREFKIRNIGYPTQLKLNSWIEDFISRMLFIQTWYDRETFHNPLIVYDISKIYNPSLFIIAILQDYARQTQSLYENVKFDIMLINVNQTKAPDRGIYIKGLKLIGANWDYSRGILTDNHPYESINVIPCIWLQPHVKFNNNDFSEIEPTNTTNASQFQRYQCPVYSYLHKKNFNNEFNYDDLYITTLELSIDNTISYWLEKNVCMVCEYDDEEEEFNILKLGEQNAK